MSVEHQHWLCSSFSTTGCWCPKFLWNRQFPVSTSSLRDVVIILDYHYLLNNNNKKVIYKGRFFASVFCSSKHKNYDECWMELMYDSGDLCLVRKSDSKKICIGFSCKTCTGHEEFTSCIRTTCHCTLTNLFFLLNITQNLGFPIIWLPL